MIAVDTNILVYAHRKDSPWNEAAYQCIAKLAGGRAPWAVPWPCIHEFMAIVTHPRMYRPPSPVGKAASQLDAWLEAPTLQLLTEAEGHWEAFNSLIVAAKSHGPQVHDARVAAICIASGVTELLTADRDFGRFDGLRVRNPLVDRASPA